MSDSRRSFATPSMFCAATAKMKPACFTSSMLRSPSFQLMKGVLIVDVLDVFELIQAEEQALLVLLLEQLGNHPDN